VFKSVIQLAYVTTDLERAVAAFRDDQGVRELASPGGSSSSASATMTASRT